MSLFAQPETYVPDEKHALRRASAELEAAKARLERDRARVIEETRTDLVMELLPVLDNLDRSIAAGAGAPAATIEGMRLVRAQLESVIRGYGLDRIDAIGQPFDPRRHEAMAVIEVVEAADDGMVIEQWQPGYELGGRLLRPARVTVGRRAR